MKDLNITYYAILAIVLTVAILRSSRGQYGKTFKTAASWVLIILVIAALYVYGKDLKHSKFYASIFPSEGVITESGTIEYTRASDGHFHIKAKVNGHAEIEFMVDTGASDIALTKADAAKLGYFEGDLQFSKVYSTANGTTRGAPVVLKNIEVGNFQTGEINASVNQGELDTSLLGMSFLTRVKSFQVSGDKLVITP